MHLAEVKDWIGLPALVLVDLFAAIRASLPKRAMICRHLREEVLMHFTPYRYLALAAIPRSARLRLAVVKIAVLLVQRVGEIRYERHESVEG